MRSLVLAAAVLIPAITSAQSASVFEVPAWAYPSTSPPYRAERPPFDSVTPLRVPNSARTFTLAQTRDRNFVPDWFPDTHPAMPVPVSRGVARKVGACGYCHLPDGQGRSENSTLAGLPAAYIANQVRDFRSRKRNEAVRKWPFGTTMQDMADSVSDADLAIAAKYFASIRAKPRYKVLERDTIQRVYQASGLYALDPGGGREALGRRLIEITEDLERFELRDPHTGFITYVPPGSIARGKALAHATGENAAHACATCHGPNLTGTSNAQMTAPPIAGRSPAYILRQLLAFRTKARDAATSGPMQQVTAAMSLDDMIAAAAYAGSRRP